MTKLHLRALSLPAPEKDKAKHYTANLKQFYGLRKDINDLRAAIDRLCGQIAKDIRGRL